MQRLITATKICIAVFFVNVAFSGCSKMVEVDSPVNKVTQSSVFAEDATATGVLTGIYSSISVNGLGNFGLLSISKRAGLSSDELVPMDGADPNDMSYFTNALGVYPSGGLSSAGHEFWGFCYNYIYTCNSAIEGLSMSNSLTPTVKQQLLGEAYFMRAFFYFYLVNLYGEIPLPLTTDYAVNRLLPRSNVESVFESIVSDLKNAQKLLSISFLNGQLKEYPERVRPSYWSATALLARAYLFMGEWSNAEEQSSIVINSTNFSLVELQQVFNANSQEAIWQLQPVIKNGTDFWNTEDARVFVLNADPIGLNYQHPVYLSSFLINEFDSSDERKNAWIGTYTDGTTDYHFPFKYKVASPSPTIDEYHIVLRLAEQYLIRAEARTHLGSTSGAVSDLNRILNRAKLASYGGPTTQASLLSAILRERQLELFTEWGHRWLDLKRTGNIETVLSVITPQKANGAPWHSYQQRYPIPLEDLQSGINLTQNTGY